MGQEGVEVDCQTNHEGSKDDYMMANEGELFEQAVVEVGVAEEGDRRAEELREAVGDGTEGDELSSVQFHGEEEGNQTATNREVQGVEGGDELQFGKEIEQQHLAPVLLQIVHAIDPNYLMITLMICNCKITLRE